MGLSLLWVVFTLIFLGLGICHWRDRATAIPELKNTIRIAAVMGVPLGAKEFVDEVNEFVKKLNARLAGANRLAAMGYFAASATALLSAWLTWRAVLP